MRPFLDINRSKMICWSPAQSRLSAKTKIASILILLKSLTRELFHSSSVNAANHQNGVIFLGHFTHGCVTADELAGRDFELELAAEVETTLFFGFAAAVGDEDVWSIHHQQEFKSFGGGRLTL